MFENFQVPVELIPSDPRFGVGPSLIPVEHLKNLVATGTSLLGTSHRKPAVKKIVKELQDGLRYYFKLPTDYEIVLGNGGATLLWDMIGLGMVEKSSLHFVTGEFSEKWYKAHAQIPWLKARQIKVEAGHGINPKDEPGYDLICSTLNETSTGVMSSFLPTLQDPHALMVLDATSGAGQIKVDWNKVDVYYFAPQKVFASDGGLYIAILSPKAVERALRLQQDKSRYIPEYMKWSHAIENSRQNQTYNTPAITTIFLMNEQVKLMNKLGEEAVVNEAKRKADLMYGWAESKTYLNPFVREKSMRSHAVITIDVDDRYKMDDLAAVLRAKNIVYDIEAYRKLNRNQLRIALFHNIAYDDLVKLTKIISLAIESSN